VFGACKCRVVGELNAADSEVVAAEHRRPVAVILHLFVFADETQKVKEVVVVEEDVTQTADEVLLTSETCSQ